MTNKTVKWIKCALVRAIKTTCQSAVSLVTVSMTITEVDWKVVLGTSLLAGLISILTSLAGLPEVDANENTTEE